MKLKAALGLVLAIASAASLAAGPKPEMMVEYRQGMMIGLAWNVGGMGQMVKGEVPWDQKRFTYLAMRAAMLAPMAREGFTPETEAIKSHAKPEIWKNLKDFDARTETMMKAAAKLVEVAQAGNEDASRAQFAETVKACKGCHEKFQEKE